VRALQVDAAVSLPPVRAACQAQGLQLFVLPHAPPNSTVTSNAPSYHPEKFDQITPTNFRISALNRELQAWEHTYIPSAPLRRWVYHTPQEFLAQSLPPRKELEVSLI